MQKYFGALTILLLLAMVWVRVLLMRRNGIKAMNFASIATHSLDARSITLIPFS